VTAPEIDRLLILGRAGKLTPVEQGQLADLLNEYRGHAHRLERCIHEFVKKAEKARP